MRLNQSQYFFMICATPYTNKINTYVKKVISKRMETSEEIECSGCGR